MEKRPSGDALRAELLRRAERDQQVRELAALPSGRLTLWQGLRGLCVDRRNTAWLSRVVRRHGWPGIAAVGAEGTAAGLPPMAEYDARMRRLAGY